MSVVDWFVPQPAAVVALAPSSLELRGYRGDTFRTRLSFRYRDGTPVVLDGTWIAQLRTTPDAAEVLGVFTVDTVEQTGGIVELSLGTAQTASLPQRSVWDLQQTPGDGQVRTWLAGTLFLGGEITRP